MPHRTWTHNCCAASRRQWAMTGERRCPYCNEPGKFAGWERSTVEHMCRFQRVTGMKAMGPGRLKIDLPIRHCRACGGSGFVPDPHRLEACAECGGDGQWLDCDEETKAWIRRRSEEEHAKYMERRRAEAPRSEKGKE